MVNPEQVWHTLNGEQPSAQQPSSPLCELPSISATTSYFSHKHSISSKALTESEKMYNANMTANIFMQQK